MDDEKFREYIIKSTDLLKDLSKQKKDMDNSKELSEDYVQGLIMGYYSIITLLKNQASTFCIDQKELGLADIKPDVDLLGLHRDPDMDFGEDNWAIDIMSEQKAKAYICDSIALLKEQAKEAKKDADNSEEGYENYNKGSVMAYCSVFSILKHQAIVFNIDEKELGLADMRSSHYFLHPKVT